MPVETRYFRSDSQTVNGLTANKLLTSQSGAAGYVTSDQFIGIRVWRRLADGTEIEITGGTAVAIADTDTADGIYSATWNCPETQLNPTDVIVVRVYSGGASPPTTLRGTWITEQLGALKLDASTWTVYYYSDYTHTKRTRHLPDCSSEQLELELWTFRFDTATYNSCIEGFAWSPAPPPVGVPRYIGDSLAGAVIIV
jgi:hypothetical protein